MIRFSVVTLKSPNSVVPLLRQLGRLLDVVKVSLVAVVFLKRPEQEVQHGTGLVPVESPCVTTDRVVGVAVQQQDVQKLTERVTQLDQPVHAGHSKTGNSGSTSAYPPGIGLVPASTSANTVYRVAHVESRASTQYCPSPWNLGTDEDA